MVVSSLPVARILPSGENTNARTALGRAGRRKRRAPLGIFHTARVLGSPTEASARPSAVRASCDRRGVSVVMPGSGAALKLCQSLTVPSSKPKATILPSSAKPAVEQLVLAATKFWKPAQQLESAPPYSNHRSGALLSAFRVMG